MQTLNAFVLSAFLTSIVSATEWPQFRGPDGQGHCAAKNLPEAWSETEHVLWKTAIPGRGWSSPVFAGNVIWLTTAIEQPLEGDALAKARQAKLFLNPMANDMKVVGSLSLRAISVDAETGKLLSNIELLTAQDPPAIHSLNTYASPTAVIQGDRLVCHFGELGTACLDVTSGQVAWKTHLPAAHAVGSGSSPAVDGDLVFLACDGTDQQYVIALNVLNGERVWKTNRPKMTGFFGDYHKAFSTPLVIEADGRKQLIAVGAQWLVAYEPATGRELWKVRHGECFSTVPRPVVAHGLVYISTGYTKPELLAVRLDGEGDVTNSHVAWRITKQVPTMPSLLVVGDEIFFVTDQGVATCADARTGEILWSKRLGGNYSASPLFADGKIYVTSRDGKTTVIRPGRTFESLAENSLTGEYMASPAVIGGDSLLFRSDTHLYRIGRPRESK